MNLRVSFHKAPISLGFGFLFVHSESRTHIKTLAGKIKDLSQLYKIFIFSLRQPLEYDKRKS